MLLSDVKASVCTGKQVGHTSDVKRSLALVFESDFDQTVVRHACDTDKRQIRSWAGDGIVDFVE